MLLIAVLLGGGVAVLLLVAGILALVVGRGGGEIPVIGGIIPALADNPLVTDANCDKLWPCMTVAQADAVLGPSRACDATEIIRVCKASFDAHHQLEGEAVVLVGEKACAVQTWRRWKNGGLHVFAGFHKSKTGVDRLVFLEWRHQLGAAFGRAELIHWFDHWQEDLDRGAAVQEKNHRNQP
jgi:hypothetical protein